MKNDVYEFKYIGIDDPLGEILIIKLDKHPKIDGCNYMLIRRDVGISEKMYVMEESIPGIVKAYEEEGYEVIYTNSFVDICIAFNKFFSFKETMRLLEEDHTRDARALYERGRCADVSEEV